MFLPVKFLYLIFILFTYCGTCGHSAASSPISRASTKPLLTLPDNDNVTVENLIQSNGYKLEIHYITTSDGYILRLHRIPSGKNGTRSLQKVAFLQHGILSSSADWVIQGAGKSLGFLLADEGYDVWMGNARGNTYSRNHTTLSPNGSEFWQFSWHEIGVVDVPQMIDYVLKETGSDGVYYVGHSQGTTAWYVMTSSLPAYNNKIKCQISLAPVAYVNHMFSPLLRLVSTQYKAIEALTDLIGVDEFLPKTKFNKFILGDVICRDDSISQELCTNTLFAICGFDRKQLNTTLLPVITKFIPAGASTKQLIHYGQEIVSGRFCQYDYGSIENLKKYGRITPPNYKLSRITAPVYLLYSLNDWLAAVVDVDRLCASMANGCKDKILIADKDFNHIDYTYGIEAPELVYVKVISLMSRH